MKLEQIERFLMVADCLNFTTAADLLYVGQSTISRQIAALEDELGVQLMIRGPRSVQLTPAGKKLQTEGKKLMEQINLMKQQVREAGSEQRQALKIVTVPAYIQALNELQEIVAEKQDYRLVFQQEDFKKLEHAVAAGTADVGASYSFWLERKPEFSYLDLCEETMVVACSRNHRVARACQRDFASYEPIYLEQLRQEKLLLGASGLYLLEHPGEFEAAEARDQNRSHASLEDLIMHLSSSDGIVIMPISTCATFPRHLAVIPLADENLRFQIVLFWKKNNEGPAMRDFLKVAETWKKQYTEY